MILLHTQKEQSLDEINPRRDVVLREVLESWRWMANHMEDLGSNGSGREQLEYILAKVLQVECNKEVKKMFSRISDYQRNVQKALNARKIQKTWGNAQTQYLPSGNSRITSTMRELS